MFLIDRLPKNHFWTNLHPIEKSLFCLVQIAFPIATPSIFALVFPGILSFFFLRAAIGNTLMAMQWLAVPVAFLVPACISVMLATGTEADVLVFEWAKFRVGFNSFSIDYGIQLFFRTVCASAALMLLAVTTPIEQIEYVLKRLHLPDIFIILLGFIYRFIGLLLSVFFQIQMAQHSRGGAYGFSGKIKSAGLLAGAMLRKGLWYQQWSSYAAQSRGFTGKIMLEQKYPPVPVWHLAVLLGYTFILVLISYYAR